MTENVLGNDCEYPQDERNDEERKSKKRAIRVSLIVLTLILLVVTLSYFGVIKWPWQNSGNSIVAGELFPGAGTADDGHLPNMTQEEIMEQMQRIADASMFSFKINARPIFANGSAAGDFRIENPNYNVYPMVVQVQLNNSKEIIYDSGGIMPNQHIEKARLLRALDAGTYDATAVFNIYDPKTKELKGKTQAALIITVQQ